MTILFDNNKALFQGGLFILHYFFIIFIASLELFIRIR